MVEIGMVEFERTVTEHLCSVVGDDFVVIVVVSAVVVAVGSAAPPVAAAAVVVPVAVAAAVVGGEFAVAAVATVTAAVELHVAGSAGFAAHSEVVFVAVQAVDVVEVAVVGDVLAQ